MIQIEKRSDLIPTARNRLATNRHKQARGGDWSWIDTNHSSQSSMGEGNSLPKEGRDQGSGIRWGSVLPSLCTALFSAMHARCNKQARVEPIFPPSHKAFGFFYQHDKRADPQAKQREAIP